MTNYSSQHINALLQDSPIVRKKRMEEAIDNYVKKARGMIETMSRYDCPPTIMDEFEIIVRESNDLLFKDTLSLDGPFERLSSYLQTQKLHLASIKSKVSPSSMYHEQISTLIVMIAMFDIDEGLTMFENSTSKNAMDMMDYGTIGEIKKEKIMARVWEAIKCLDTFEMSYKFKYDIYDKRREELKKMCRYSYVDVRTKQEVRKDALENASDDVLGCIFKIGILVLVAMFLSFLFNH